MKWLLIPLTIWAAPTISSQGCTASSQNCAFELEQPPTVFFDSLDECRAALRERTDPTDAVCVEVHGWTKGGDLKPY